MKVAIVTITDGANYGNRLQNYALQTALEEFGCSVETIQSRSYRDKSLFQNFVCLIKNFLKKIIGKETDGHMRIRIRQFSKFNSKYIKLSKFVLKNNHAPESISRYYDYFICGSDQIWNTKIRIIRDDIKNYLAFFSPPEKRISYAASFGTNVIDEKYIPFFKEELSKFKSISVREAVGVDIVRNLCKKEAHLVLDPTMLISSTKWSEIAKKPKYATDNDFILTYFLGGRNDSIKKYISDLQVNFENCKVYNLDIEFKKITEIEDISVYLTTPDEFIWLIKNAKCVLTDSFHATVFSVIFGKPFMVFDRIEVEKGNNMGSRIDTLLSKFNLEFNRDDINSPSKIPAEYDYNAIDKILESERKHSLKFLKDAINI